MESCNPFGYILDAQDIRMINYNIKYKSIPTYIKELLHEIDLPNYPYSQTIHFSYGWSMAALIYLGYDKAELMEIHKSNLEYEREHPPVIYEKGNKKTSVKRITKKVKAKTIVSDSIKTDKENTNVRLIKLSNNKVLTVARITALGIIQQFPNDYKIEEINE